MGLTASLQAWRREKNECWERNDDSDCGSDKQLAKHMTERVYLHIIKRAAIELHCNNMRHYYFSFGLHVLQKISFSILARICTAAAPQSHI